MEIQSRKNNLVMTLSAATFASLGSQFILSNYIKVNADNVNYNWQDIKSNDISASTTVHHEGYHDSNHPNDVIGTTTQLGPDLKDGDLWRGLQERDSSNEKDCFVYDFMLGSSPDGDGFYIEQGDSEKYSDHAKGGGWSVYDNNSGITDIKINKQFQTMQLTFANGDIVIGNSNGSIDILSKGNDKKIEASSLDNAKLEQFNSSQSNDGQIKGNTLSSSYQKYFQSSDNDNKQSNNSATGYHVDHQHVHTIYGYQSDGSMTAMPEDSYGKGINIHYVNDNDEIVGIGYSDNNSNDDISKNVPQGYQIDTNTKSWPISQNDGDTIEIIKVHKIGTTQSGNAQNGNALSSNAQNGNAQNGNAQNGNAQNGNAQSGNAQTGNAQSGNVQPGNVQSGNVQAGNAQSGNVQAGNVQTGNAQSGNAQNGNAQSGNAQSGNAQNSNAQLGNAQLGNAQSSNAQSGNAQNSNAKLVQTASENAISLNAILGLSLSSILVLAAASKIKKNNE